MRSIIEIKECLSDMHEEENKDGKKYEDLAYDLKMNDCHEASGILLDIARDEKSHAKALHYILNMEDFK